VNQSTKRAIAIQLMAWEFCIPITEAIKQWPTGTPAEKGSYMDKAEAIAKIIEEGQCETR
jgi:hypothetical protein